ncbi:hypothetical protein Z517_11292 [Fonsecaea pedrosoi CBS 271.37]|uniref:Uncharacterized protein n=1 Tax=Fonsecaea pedrosoi CBS 271.37 TaxID=1442368 RepID=A0A0D2EJK5_9EURO|nr:uncharacterized protein Z517_11292 [Fonsecaea pedrosoi CBS 271.37]KIW74522.1 hypothetical protein Z517_11292 [Fonsecaea pedrosoi CBS 271.37]
MDKRLMYLRAATRWVLCLPSLGSETELSDSWLRGGKHVFLIRKENNPCDTIPDVRGYGHMFPEAYTNWDPACIGSQSHQRLVSYSFGGLNLGVRPETDGYFPRKLEDDNQAKRPGSYTASGNSKDVASAFARTKVFSDDVPSDLTDSKALKVCHGEHVCPQESIFDLKTRAPHNCMDMNEMHVRLWVNQVPNFIVAYHDRGAFKDVQIKDVRAGVEDWEDNNKETLERLKEVLNLLDVLAQKQVNWRIEILRVAKGNLAVWSNTSGNALCSSPGAACQMARREEDSFTVSEDFCDSSAEAGGCHQLLALVIKCS